MMMYHIKKMFDHLAKLAFLLVCLHATCLQATEFIEPQDIYIVYNHPRWGRRKFSFVCMGRNEENKYRYWSYNKKEQYKYIYVKAIPSININNPHLKRFSLYTVMGDKLEKMKYIPAREQISSAFVSSAIWGGDDDVACTLCERTIPYKHGCMYFKNQSCTRTTCLNCYVHLAKKNGMNPFVTRRDYSKVIRHEFRQCGLQYFSDTNRMIINYIYNPDKRYYYLYPKNTLRRPIYVWNSFRIVLEKNISHQQEQKCIDVYNEYIKNKLAICLAKEAERASLQIVQNNTIKNKLPPSSLLAYLVTSLGAIVIFK